MSLSRAPHAPGSFGHDLCGLCEVLLCGLCVFSFVEPRRTQVRATASVEAEREPPRQPRRLPPLLRKEGSFSPAVHHSPFTFFQRPNGRFDRVVIIANRRARFEAQTAQNVSKCTKCTICTECTNASSDHRLPTAAMRACDTILMTFSIVKTS